MIERRYTFAGLAGNIFAVWFVGVVFGEILLSQMPLTATDPLTRPLLITISVTGTVFLCWQNIQKKRSIARRPQDIKEIAQAGGLTFESRPTTDIRSANFKLIEQRDNVLMNGLSGTDWRYGELQYYLYRRAKSDEYRSAAVYYSILQLDLGRELPNVFFDNKKSHGKQFSWKIDANQITSLEGNFDDYFVTYFPEGYHIDARSVVSPEVMAAMIDASPCDIEIYQNKLYLYSALMKPEDILGFVEKGRKIRASLMDHAQYYIDDLARDDNTKDVSVYGIELNRHTGFPWSITLGLPLWIPILIFAVVAYDPLRIATYTGIALLNVIIAIRAVYKWRSAQQRLKRKRENLQKAMIERDERYLQNTQKQSNPTAEDSPTRPII